MTKKPSLGAIFLTVFLDLLGFGLVLPFLAEEARDGFHTTALTGTLLAAVYSLMQFLFVPVWGRLSDRIGRRPVLVVSVAATFVGMSGLGVAIGWGNSVAWLFAARIFSGIATANLGTASAYIADVTSPEDRARGMGLIGMAFGLGFILGPGIGGALSAITINGRHGAIACFAAAGLSVINFVWVQVGLAESLPKEKRTKSTRRLVPLDLHAAKEAFARPGIALCVLVNFVIVLSFTNLDQTFRFYNKDVFHMSPVETGLVLASVGVVAAGVQGGLIRRLSRRYGEGALIVGGVLLQAIAFAGIAWAPAVGMAALFVAMGLLAIGNGLTQPSTSAYVSKRADPRAQGNALGTNQSAASLARTLGPALGGWLYGAFGPQSPYIVAAAGMGLAFLVALGLDRSKEIASVAVPPP
jgi:MFS transporter, DHA1 family, tetracycline resistance protein